MTEDGSSVFVVSSCRAESASTLLAVTSLWLNKVASCQGKRTLPDISGLIRTLNCTVCAVRPLHFVFQHILWGKRGGNSTEIKGCTPGQAVW